ncbi:MAG TPA: nuclear transport factor 2 family protein [Cyclobacteriaceae bacterium]|nr:nuclear transport factor 2 family protein [Cyclobacteriaceae bacterium]
MKNYILPFAFLLLGLQTVFGQKADQQILENKVQELRTLLITPDQQQLEKITSEQLTYGHSNGRVENQKEFIDFMLSGVSKFVTIELQDQTVDIAGNTGIVRHTLVAETNNEGETVNIKIGVILVWQKDGQQWKLLARQAFKL